MLPEDLVLAVTVLAISISKRLENDDAALLGAVFTQLGDTLTTIAAAKIRMEQLEEAQQQKQAEDAPQPETPGK